MIRVADNRVEVSGPLTMSSGAALLVEGEAALAAVAADVAEFDLGAVSEMDSSGLAVIFGWMRAARAAGKSFRIVNSPESLLSLAAVYGVAEFLPQH
ncbi:MAG: STAS domain-containing protein [Rugosibacter sp.]|nr:STAS domain-containing protein [Rugosibacter sp.]